MMIVSCIEQGQKYGPTLAVKKTSASLDDFFLHRLVIKRGIANTWGIWGCARQSSLNNSTTFSIAAGVGIQSLGMYCVCNSNQSPGANFLRGRPPHAASVVSFHQEVIQLTTLPLDLLSSDSFSRISSNGF